jgi:hypothetical protein
MLAEASLTSCERHNGALLAAKEVFGRRTDLFNQSYLCEHARSRPGRRLIPKERSQQALRQDETVNATAYRE